MKRHIPSIFTFINLICGFTALLMGDLYFSAILILVGMLFDVADGMAARFLNAQSEIGKELDSMADLITFGVAPAYLYFLLAPGIDWYYYLPALILLMGSTLRLAIFNTLPSKKTFTGLATPASALFMFGIIMSYNHQVPIIEKLLSDDIGYFIVPIFLSTMMLSRVEMFSLKSMKNPFYKNFYHLTSIIIFLIVLIINPPLSTIAGVLSYIVLSTISWKNLFRQQRKNSKIE